uniref:Uncharacterized protein n=1 Tax=Magnetococcus massalia (strain MO-1) TaxID=451514 RepID=A0A1S7LJA6_MAGMO|nr:conserved protein of unknown function [Candidatus Magnetococcus massalia]
MGLNEIVEKLSDFFDKDKKKQRAQKEQLKSVLKTLRQKENKLKSALEQADSGKKKKQIQKKLEIIHAQRSKGVKLCRKIKCKS